MRVLVRVEGVFDAGAAEPALRLARIEIYSESQEHDGIVLFLVRQDIALPIIDAQPAHELHAKRMRQPVNSLPLVDQSGVLHARGGRLAAEEEGSGIVDGAAAKLAAIRPLPPCRPLPGEAPADAVARALFRDGRRTGFLPFEALEVAAHPPAGLRRGAEREKDQAAKQAHHIRSIIACPKPEQETCFAPCIWRAKS